MAVDNTIPEGAYRVRTNKFEFKAPKNSSNRGTELDPKYYDEKGEQTYPYFSADLIVQDDGEFFGRHVFDNYISTAPGDDWKLRQYADGAELPEDEDFESEKMVDSEFYVVVTKSKEGKGKDGNWYPAMNRVSRVMKLSEASKLPKGSRQPASV
jgi:hypothetical protein